MNNLTHDPKEHIKGLQQILISDTKKIGFLFGAGTSLAIKKGASRDSVVPGIQEMTKIIISSLTNPKHKSAISTVEKELNDDHLPINIENILSSVTQKEQVIGSGTLCGLNKNELKDLQNIIEKKIIEIVSVHKLKDSFINDLVHSDFAQWIKQANRKFPIEVFTTNYDYLFEIGFEFHNLSYFDGFIGGFEPFFDSNCVSETSSTKNWTKLWKIHGSLGWEIDKKFHKVIRKYNDNISSIVIFPSILKYDNSKKQPYVSFIDRLSNFIKQEDSILFISGYSFSDQHINDTILNALSYSQKSSAIGFYFDDFDESAPITIIGKSQPKLSIYGKKNAIIGNKFGKWKLTSEPSKEDSIQIDTYFDEDAMIPTSAWTGEGNFKLIDFALLVEFLSYLNYEKYKPVI